MNTSEYILFFFCCLYIYLWWYICVRVCGKLVWIICSNLIIQREKQKTQAKKLKYNDPNMFMTAAAANNTNTPPLEQSECIYEYGIIRYHTIAIGRIRLILHSIRVSIRPLARQSSIRAPSSTKSLNGYK